MSFIYIIDTGIGWTKIGQTIMPEIRFSDHKREWPDLKVLALIPCINCKTVEKEIFRQLEREGYERYGRRELFIGDQKLKQNILVALFSVKRFCMDLYKEQKKIIDMANL